MVSKHKYNRELSYTFQMKHCMWNLNLNSMPEINSSWLKNLMSWISHHGLFTMKAAHLTWRYFNNLSSKRTCSSLESALLSLEASSCGIFTGISKLFVQILRGINKSNTCLSMLSTKMARNLLFLLLTMLYDHATRLYVRKQNWACNLLSCGFSSNFMWSSVFLCSPFLFSFFFFSFWSDSFFWGRWCIYISTVLATVFLKHV